MANKDYEQKKRECLQEFCKLHDCETPVMRLNFDWTFDRAFALGKQEKDAEDTVIQGWVARDDDGDLRIYREMPKRSKREGMWDGNIAQIVPSPLLFPDFTWDSDPEPVEIIIKRKKNG